MADYAIPKNAVAYIYYGCLVSQADTKLFKSVPTIAAGDFKVSIDGGAFANLATLPTNTPGTFSVKFSLSAAEMTGDNILVVANDVAGAEWCDQSWNIQTAPRGVADLTFPTVSGRSLDVSATGEAGLDWANIGGPTTAVNLSATNINVSQVVASVSGAVGSVTGAVGSVTGAVGSVTGAAGSVTGNVGGSVASVTAGVTLAANAITAAATATDFGTEIATAIWTDAVATDFTAALSVGKSVMNGVALGTGLTINAYTGNTAQTGDSFARIGLAGAGLTNIDLPNQTMDIVGNITGNLSGSVGSVTGAAGSVTGAVGSVTGAVGSVTGNVGGNVVGSVASVTAAVAITSNAKKNQALTAFAFLMTDSTAHTPATGKTVTVTRSIDGAAFAAGTLSAVTEVANGMYVVSFGAGDLNGNVITLRATAATSDDTFATVITQP